MQQPHYNQHVLSYTDFYVSVNTTESVQLGRYC